MNNKSRIFFAAHEKLLLKKTNVSIEAICATNTPSEVSKIFLEIAHLYIKDIAADESDYWMSFVFDTCATLGMCSKQYISHLSQQQKRDYIKATLMTRLTTSKEIPINCHTVSRQICDYSRDVNSRDKRSDIDARQVASAILDYIHILISIDRIVDDDEDAFFRAIRDRVYAEMGWQQVPVSSFSSAGSIPGRSSRKSHDEIEISHKSVEELLVDIDRLIGLDTIKNEVRSLINSLQVKIMRQSVDLPNAEVSNHMVFYGNPGTGKTTIARILGELYCRLGVLSKGHFIETDRSGLVGGYLGQTALKTAGVLESALGGILFIDEAYTLSPGDNNDQYGQEAIDTLLKYMEDHRDDMVVIVAGYENLMGNFLQSNPGLKSRFNKYFFFKDYSPCELVKIFLSISADSSYLLDESAKGHLEEVILELVRQKENNFGNARTIRNLFERSISNQANRIMQQNINSKEELACLKAEDILWGDMEEIAR